jgi:protein disulfide-isomerase
MKLLRLIPLICLSCTQIFATDVKWFTDFNAAQQYAQGNQLPMLLDFTGSDWCPWCIKEHNDVLAKEAFKSYASTNLVLVELDFPRHTAQDPETAKQNADLQRKYQANGFPTLIKLSASGEFLWKQEGYDASVDKLLENLKSH